MPTFATSTLEDRVWKTLDSNTTFFPEAQVLAALNEGLRRLNLHLGISQATVAIPTFSVANQLEYSVPAGILIPLRVFYERRELSKTSLRTLGRKFRSWATDSTTAQGPVARWAPVGITQFVIHPRCASGDRLLEVQGIAPITPLVNQTDVVTLEDQWAELLVDYARIRVLLKDSAKTFADASLGYQRMMGMLKTATIWKSMQFPRYFVQKALEPAEGRAT